MGKGAKPPTSSETQAIRQLRVQSSTYGGVIPICYGQVRIAGNILWAGGFRADDLNAPSGGAKGGRVSLQQYQYYVSVILGLCEGPVIGLGRAYLGDSPQADATPTQLNGSRPEGSPPYLSRTNPSCWRMKRVVSVTDAQPDPTAGFWQFGPTPMVLGTVPATIPNTASGNDQTWSGPQFKNADTTKTYIRHKNSAADQYWDVLVETKNGAPKYADSDTANDPAALTKGTQALTYPGIAYVAGKDVHLDSQASLPNYNFPLIGFAPYSWLWGSISDAELIEDLQSNARRFDDDDNPVVLDALATNILYDLLTNTRYGVGWSTALLADITSGRNSHAAYCRAFGIWFSPVYDQQRTAADIIQELADLSNSGLVWSEGRLKVIPYGDEAYTGPLSGVDYVPTSGDNPDGASIVVRYALDDDAFLVESAGDDPVEIRRQPPTDVYTSQSVEFLARGRGYRQETAQATDAAGIATESGAVREASVKQAHMICSRRLARDTAQRILQRQVAIRNTYTFRLGWRYILLEPMDVVTLTDTAIGLAVTPVRITSVEEDEHGTLTIEAEDLPIGTATAISYRTPASRMGGVDFNVPPGPTHQPIVFEPIYPLATEPELWIGASGTPSTWGGAAIYVAETEDGDYIQVGTLQGRAAHGFLIDALPLVASPDRTSDVRVWLRDGGVLASASTDDAAALHRLLYLGHGNTYELVSHSTAILTSTHAGDASSVYELKNYLVRGAYATSPQAWSAGTPLLRLDTHIARIALPTRLLGKTVYLKLLPINTYGALVVGLEDVAPIYHHVDGTWWLTPPPDVTGTHVTFLDGYAQLQWDRIDADFRALQIEYEVRSGPAWATASVLGRTKDTRFVIRGTGTFWVAATVALETGLLRGRVYSELPDSIVVSEATQTTNFFRETDLATVDWAGDVDPYPLAVWALEPQVYLRFCDGANLGHDSAGYYTDNDGGITVFATSTPAAGLLPVYDAGRTGGFTCASSSNVTLHDDSSPVSDLRRYVDGWSLAFLLKRSSAASAESLLSVGHTTSIRWHVVVLSTGAIRVQVGTTGTVHADSITTPLHDTATHRIVVRVAGDSSQFPMLYAIGTGALLIEVLVDGVVAVSTVVVAELAGQIQLPGRNVSGASTLTGIADEVAYVDRYLSDDEAATLEAAFVAPAVGGLVVDRIAGRLLVGSLGAFDAIANVDAAATVDYTGGVATGGTFVPDAGTIRQVLSCRTTARPYVEVDAAPLLPGATFDAIAVVDDAGGIDGVDPGALTVTTEFGPGVTALAEDRISVAAALATIVPYDTFRPYRAGVLTLQRLRWRLTLTATQPGVGAECTRLLLGCDALPRRETGAAVGVGAVAVTPLGSGAGTADASTPLVVTTLVDVPVGDRVIVLIASVFSASSPNAFVTDTNGNDYSTGGASRPTSTIAPMALYWVSTVTGTPLAAGSTITITRPGSSSVAVAVTVLAVHGLASATPTNNVTITGAPIVAYDTLTHLPTGTLAAAPSLIVAAWALARTRSDQYVPDQGTAVVSAGSDAGVAQPVALVGQWIAASTTATVTASGRLDPRLTWATPVGAVFTLNTTTAVTTIRFAKPFNAPPAVQVSVRDAQPGDTVTITRVGTDSFDVRILDALSAVATRAMDWVADGD